MAQKAKAQLKIESLVDINVRKKSSYVGTSSTRKNNFVRDNKQQQQQQQQHKEQQEYHQ